MLRWQDRIVLDRYWPSTFAYGAAASGGSDDGIVEWPAYLVRPTLVVLLVLPESARRSRLQRRTEVPRTQEEERLEEKQAFRERVMALYRRVPGIKEINSDRAVGDIVRDVKALFA